MKTEFSIQLDLGKVLTGFPGPKWKNTYTRALELCELTGNTVQLCKIMGELSLYYYVRAQHDKAKEFGEQALSQAQLGKDDLLVSLGHWYLGISSMSQGEYPKARVHFEEMTSFYNVHEHHMPYLSLRGSDPGLSALSYLAVTLWCLGYPDQALQKSKDAISLARKMEHPFSLADVLCYGGCMLNEMRRDAVKLKQHAAELTVLGVEKVESWLPSATRYGGGALSLLGQFQEGIVEMQKGMEAMRSMGVRCYLSGAFRAIAEAQANNGDVGAAIETLIEAIEFVEDTNERHWEAEIYRLWGTLLIKQNDENGAEEKFHQAIDIARQQHAKSGELRSVISLARLLQRQGKSKQAVKLLLEIYSWFTEGFETPDLIEAKAFLDELGS